MKRKRFFLFCCIAGVLILFGVASFISHTLLTEPFFSLTPLSQTNLIDIRKLSEFDYGYISTEGYEDVFVHTNDSLKQVYFDDKQLQSLELSPSQKKVAFYYFSDEPEGQELSLILLDLNSGNISEIFHTAFPSWDVRSHLHWLGDNNLFFIRHCGTACLGITLLNIETGETRNALLSYPSFPDQPKTTFFRDWFGREYRMDGLVQEVTSQTIDNNHYLVFILDGVGERKLVEKRIPFTDSEMSTLLSTK